MVHGAECNAAPKRRRAAADELAEQLSSGDEDDETGDGTSKAARLANQSMDTGSGSKDDGSNSEGSEPPGQNLMEQCFGNDSDSED